MDMKYIEKISLSNEIVDGDKFFTIGYCRETGTYMMSVLVLWVAGYERYYRICKEDYELYQNDRVSFYNKYSREIGQKKDCYTENFIGAAALRDYDGVNRFQDAYSAKDINPFQHFVLIDGILYARIVWEIGEIYVPPVQMIDAGNGKWRFPLRDRCILQENKEGQPICYRFSYNLKLVL